jgi:ADP-ribose pyrophosphatase YjhB (NUDIX family)
MSLLTDDSISLVSEPSWEVNVQPIVRATAILIEAGHVLLVRQKVSATREWSLPGGSLEFGESLEECVVREVREEAGIEVAVERLLYVCDRIEDQKHVVHITLAVRRVGGWPGPAHEGGDDGLNRVRMVPLESLVEYGFTERFRDLALAGFPEAGTYRGSIANIGL